jgi:F0F1-type ATP synthase gamma subunit
MKKRKYLETDFIRFLKEKYSENDEDEKLYPIPDDEEKKQLQEEEEETDEEEENSEEILDDLVKEYKQVKKEFYDLLLHKYKS